MFWIQVHSREDGGSDDGFRLEVLPHQSWTTINKGITSKWHQCKNRMSKKYDSGISFHQDKKKKSSWQTPVPSLRVGLPQFLFLFSKNPGKQFVIKQTPSTNSALGVRRNSTPIAQVTVPLSSASLWLQGGRGERVHTDFQLTDVTSIKEKRFPRGNLVSIFLKHLF